MRHVLPVSAAVVSVLGLLVVLGGGADGLPRWVREGVVAAVVTACAIGLVILFVAPGFGEVIARPLEHLWQRLRARGNELGAMKERAEQLQHPHHMLQLGNSYLGQGRFGTAVEWFTKALDKDEEHVDARYKLAICWFELKDYVKAVELLEDIHARHPGHDYGGAYLRLARAQEQVGNDGRAREVYSTLLRFYPGHPEGTYRFARLVEGDSDGEMVRDHMRQIVSAVRNSPPFQRRRNRHWMLKAQWWLWRN